MASLTVAPVSSAPPRALSPPASSDSFSGSDTARKKRHPTGDPNAAVAGADIASLASAQRAARASLVAVRAIETPVFTPVVVTPTETG